jgi:hypothetical protein
MSSCDCTNLKAVNSTNVQWKEIDNDSALIVDRINLTDTQMETYICNSLVDEVQPNSLIEYGQYLSPVDNRPSSMGSAFDASYARQNILVTNTESILDNELFCAKTVYVSSGNGGSISLLSNVYNILVHNNHSTSGEIKSIITQDLDPQSSTNYSCNIKIDISFNSDTQYTINLEENDLNQWSMDYTRDLGMNYFSLINSKSMNNSDNWYWNYPLQLYFEPNNQYALGNYTQYYFTANDWGVADNSGTLNLHTITEGNILSSNNYSADINTSYNLGSGNFGSYSLHQPAPTISATIKNGQDVDVSGSELPFVFNGNDISGGSFNVSGLFNDTEGIESGFTITLEVGGDNNGGYDIQSNNMIGLDQSSLYKATDSSYIHLDLSNVYHYVDVTNGTLDLSANDASSNVYNIPLTGLTTGAETLESPYNGENGILEIFVKPKPQRVYYVGDFGQNGQNNTGYEVSDLTGTKSNLTSCVDIVYNADETTPLEPHELSGNFLTCDYAYGMASVIVPATTWESTFSQEADARNIMSDNSGVLVIANDIPFDISGEQFDFTCSLPNLQSEVQIIAIKNVSLLAQNTPVLDPTSTTVPNTSATVALSNVDLASLDYNEYQLKLTTKTVADISDALAPTGGWVLLPNLTNDSGNTQGYVRGTALKTGMIEDDYLFMSLGAPVSNNSVGEMDISMTYTFEVDNQSTYNDVQAIKHRVNISFVDISSVGIYNTYTSHEIVDDSELTYLDVSYTDVQVGSNLTDVTLVSSLPATVANRFGTSFTFQKRRRVKKFRAQFDSKFPLYTNVLFQTPLMTETIDYFAVYDQNGTQMPSYILQYYTSSLHGYLYNVLPTLAQTYKSEFLLTPSVLSIFNAEILAKRVNDDFATITDSADLDPFFRLITKLNYGSSIFEVKVKFANNPSNVYNNSYVNQPYYTVDSLADPANTTQYYARLVNLTDQYDQFDDPYVTCFDQFNPYGNFYDGVNRYGDAYSAIDLDVLSDVVNGRTTLTIMNGPDELATIAYNSNYLFNMNIIKAINPYFHVGWEYWDNNENNYDWNYYYTFGNANQVIEIVEGMYYYYHNNPEKYYPSTNFWGSHYGIIRDEFELVKDSFKLRFVNDNGFSNNPSNLWDDYNFFIDYALGPDNAYYTNGSGANQTRGVYFNQVRGYYRGTDTVVGEPSGFGGQDTIVLKRTTTTVTFVMELPAQNGGATVSQTFTNVANGSNLTLNNVGSYNLGLILVSSESMLDTGDSTSYEVYITIADYYWSVSSNGANRYELVGIYDSGYLNDTYSIINRYISGIAPRAIFTDYYKVTITYTVPDMVVTRSSSYIGAPETQTYSEYDTYSYNDILDYNGTYGGITIAGVVINRDMTTTGNNGDYVNVIYDAIQTYFVVAPPVVSVWGIPFGYNVSSLPIDESVIIDGQQYFKSFHILNTSTAINYTIGSSALSADGSSITNGNDITISQSSSPVDFYTYLTNNDCSLFFDILGNYMKMSLYANGIAGVGSSTINSPVPDDPVVVDNRDTVVEVLYNGLIDNVSADAGSYSNSDYYTASIDASLNWHIAYQQKTPSTNDWNPVANIFYIISNNFCVPSSGAGNSYYLQYNLLAGSSVVFYQSFIEYIGTSDISGYYVTVEKYTSDTVDYSNILNNSAMPFTLYFLINKREYKQWRYDTTNDIGNLITIDSLELDISMAGVAANNWTVDNDFTNQDLGLSMAAINPNGLQAMKDFFIYNQTDRLLNKAWYVYRPDFVQLKNAIGAKIYRVTADGNVYTPQTTTKVISLFY